MYIDSHFFTKIFYFILPYFYVVVIGKENITPRKIYQQYESRERIISNSLIAQYHSPQTTPTNKKKF